MPEKPIINPSPQPLSLIKNDFKNIIENKAIFVDKSALIKEIIEDNSSVIIFLRGHGFSKSTNLAMIGTFFAKAPSHNQYQTNTASLFHQLKIWKNFGQQYRSYQGKYPVLFLDFSTINTTDILQDILAVIYREVVKQYQYYGKPIPTDLAQDVGCGLRIGRSVRELMCLLTLDYNQECVVIIDDYDKPFQTDAYSKDNGKIFGTVTDLLSFALKGNPYLYKGILTGSFQEQYKPSHFNNFTLDTIFHKKYHHYFGFTKPDIMAFFEPLSVQDQQQLSDWYGGYHFCGEEMYHPAAIVHYAHQRRNKESTDLMPAASRANTSALVNLKVIDKGMIEALLAGEVMQTRLMTLFTEWRQEPQNTVLNTLLLAGYLTAVPNSIDISERQLIQVKIPNQDIAHLLEKYVLPRLTQACTNVLRISELYLCLGQFCIDGIDTRYPDEMAQLITLIKNNQLADATALIDVIKAKHQLAMAHPVAGYAQAMSRQAHGSPLHQAVRQEDKEQRLTTRMGL